MRTTILLRDVVGKATYIFLIRIIPLQCDFYRNTVISLRSSKMENIIQVSFAFVNIFNELRQTAFIIKDMLGINAFVTQHNTHTCVQERQFTQTTRQNINIKNGLTKSLGTWPETDTSTGSIGIAHYF